MMYKLGLNPPRPGSIKMRFGSYLTAAALPPVPAVFPDFPTFARIRNWGMLGNDTAGDCYWAGAAHETMLLYGAAGMKVPMFTTRTTLDDYHAATGPGDVGTDMQAGCAYRQKKGIVDALGNQHKIEFYTSLTPGNFSELDLAVYLFGVAGIGVQLPDTAEAQFNYGEVWGVEPGSESKGGHYIPCIGRNSHGNYLVVTWGRLQAVDPEWLEEYMDQGVVMVSQERVNAEGLTPQGINMAQLEDDYHQLTGE
jgi:hypothetical protein